MGGQATATGSSLVLRTIAALSGDEVDNRLVLAAEVGMKVQRYIAIRIVYALRASVADMRQRTLSYMVHV